MTYDEAKKAFKSLKDIQKLIRVLQRRIADEKSEIDISAIDYTRERIRGGEYTPAQQRFAEHIEKLESQLDIAITSMMSIEDMITDNLANLSPIEQTIMIEKYLHNQSWCSLELKYHYSRDGLYDIQSRAINKIVKWQNSH